MPQNSSSQVPHLTTALKGPIGQLEKILLDKQLTIETWFRQQWQQTSAPLTTSVDVRNSGFKIAPVDTNLFPAGFNNLNRDFLPLCIQAAQNAINEQYPNCKRILLIPEAHTRNRFYLISLATMQEILVKAGYDVRVGFLLEGMTQSKVVELDDKNLILEPIIREGDRIGLKDFDPCLILLNNDLTSGVPEILQGIKQAVRPPLELGWSQRLKSTHFQHYKTVTEEFAELVGIDPWLITPSFKQCGEVDFVKREGEECVAKYTEQLLEEIQEKYATYKIDHKPFVAVKADAGTYGMGVMMVRSADELRNLNRKQRSKMAATKGKKITKVIIQEGVYSFETWGDDNAVAEPVVYSIGQHVVGGFYRVHTGRGIDENLNAPGMKFEPLAFAKSCNAPDQSLSPEEQANRFYAYGVIARLAILAAARELAAVT